MNAPHSPAGPHDESEVLISLRQASVHFGPFAALTDCTRKTAP